MGELFDLPVCSKTASETSGQKCGPLFIRVLRDAHPSVAGEPGERSAGRSNSQVVWAISGRAGAYSILKGIMPISGC